MRQRIYIDTSVAGGFFDEEFKDATQRLFGRLEKDEVRFIISDLLELELIQAPRQVSELLTIALKIGLCATAQGVSRHSRSTFSSSPYA